MNKPHPVSPIGADTAAEPKLVLIPSGWFSMGSEVGQENERPVHRVWIDAFYLAGCQVTNGAA